MPFNLVDRVLEKNDNRIITLTEISPSDKYLEDHFPSFPIMPGVLMLETMVQAAIQLLPEDGERYVLGEAKAIKYGAMIKPNDCLKVEVEILSINSDSSANCKGTGTVFREGNGNTKTAVAGRFTIRPACLFEQ